LFFFASIFTFYLDMHKEASLLQNLWKRFTWFFNKYGPDEEAGRAGDFTTTPHVLILAILTIGIGAISGVVALVLLRLISFFTNLFFFLRLSLDNVSPAHNTLGALVIIVPVIGGLIVGLMARFGSDKIRGHGIPEAIESILINGSKIQPRVALLKPISAAIAIGSGGPFGAEGPIIMTGGAVGSLIAQTFHLTSTERKILLVAGAAGGMSAVFDTPIAAVLLAVELLLFEWKPRSLVPVALASVTAALVRFYLLGPGPLFPVPAHAAFIGTTGLLCCVLVGVLAGLLSSIMTVVMYAFEDAFHKLPIHWMWWPALGGLAIGLGGLIFPQALGVGYDIIGMLLQGKATLAVIIGILIVKSLIWSISLGSGTSGGVVAPLLMIGCAFGAVLSLFLPNEGVGFWSLICMAAVLASTMRAPFTGIVFALELTHDFNSALPLLITVIVAYTFTVLVMRRSILTEKVSRRGFHLSQEYAIDPMEILQVREVMRTNIIALPATTKMQEIATLLNDKKRPRGQHLFPVVDEQQLMIGVTTRRELLFNANQDTPNVSLLSCLKPEPIIAFPDEPLRRVVNRMAATGYTRMPVVERDNERNLLGIVSLNDLLQARTRMVNEERQRERVINVRLFIPTPIGFKSPF
jgi:H+/Cl- antiporter ClcA/CBS domain-containing protein